MIDISLNNISISFGFKHVLEKFNLEVKYSDKEKNQYIYQIN